MKHSTIVYAAVASIGLALSMAWATSLVRAQDTAAVGYRIGVVDMREVFQKYDRREAEFQKLLTERDAAQTQVDGLAEKINAARKDYDAKKQSAPADDLDELEMKILSDISNLEAEQKRLQNDVSMVEDKMLKDLNQEIRTAIAEVGQSENYHLILESGAQGGAVLYSATPLNLTSKVIERLNKKSR